MTSGPDDHPPAEILPARAADDSVAELFQELGKLAGDALRRNQEQKEAERLAAERAREEAEQERKNREQRSKLAPVLGQDACVCPQCHTYAQQEWYQLEFDPYRRGRGNIANLAFPEVPKEHATTYLQEAFMQYCVLCKKRALWIRGEIVFPATRLFGPPPHEKMPVEVQVLHDEARAIAVQSPRAAAAILRLALEKLLTELGIKPGPLSARLEAAADSHVLTAKMQNAAHAIKELGDHGVHPGVIDLHEDPSNVEAMLRFLNLIVSETLALEDEVAKILKKTNDARAATRRNDKRQTS